MDVIKIKRLYARYDSLTILKMIDDSVSYKNIVPLLFQGIGYIVEPRNVIMILTI